MISTIVAPALASFLLVFVSVLPIQRYNVADQSTMQISGGSSMHDWACDAAVTGTVDRQSDEPGVLPIAVAIRVDVEEIECGKRIMNKKLRKAFQSGRHPSVEFVMDDVSWSSDDVMTAEGTVTAAGVVRSVSVDVTEILDERGNLSYTGSVDMLMTDFGIKPPTAMLGAMKTHDEVTVSFEIFITPVS
ncbi:MAG: YceI family protein [Rhodothermales bacterium]|nr:YceI family protein [Rhodothermales bacterium]